MSEATESQDEQKNKGGRTTEPTPLQKKAFRIFARKVKNGEFSSWGECMRQAGYAETTARAPKENLTSKEGFKKLLKTYEMEPIMDNLYQIATQSDDKRSAIQAGKQFIKLRELQPAEKHEISVVEEQSKVFK